MRKFHTLRLLLGDQLDIQHQWFNQTSDDVCYVLAQLRQETDYALHHIQKVCAFFSAMEQFAGQLQNKGHHVRYLTLNDTNADASLDALIIRLCREHQVKRFEYQQPDEYRLHKQLQALELQGHIEINCVDTQHFLLPMPEIPQHFAAGKSVRMEHFYRKMRKRFDILMEDGKPVGGKWNYDQQNRQRLKQKDLDAIPAPLEFSHDVSSILQLLHDHEVNTIGQSTDSINLPVTRAEAIELLSYFCAHCLEHFGTFQDAMTANSPYHWSLYHSRLSFALNIKLISPAETIDTVLKYYAAGQSTIGIAQVEGFIRQILGWREYMRGVYWANMPDYQSFNHFEANHELPGFFWDAHTRMNCMHHAIAQSLDYAYAHHIQRLMITGNFCLLAGISPDQVDHWYLGIYADAIEWVQLPNTRGMSQYADGGIIASKPYASSGNYINKMSDYCNDCHYRVREKVGDSACPFNALYWNFIHQHSELLKNNQRMSMIYRSWEKMNSEDREQIINKAQQLIEDLENL